MFGKKKMSQQFLTMDAEPLRTVSAIKFETEVEIKTKDIEVTASGYSAEGIAYMISSALGFISESPDNGLSQAFMQTLKENEEKEKNGENPNPKRRVHQVSEEDRVESIDLSDIKDKIRLPRTSNDFRCPHCAQAFITRVSKQGRAQWIFRDAASETPIGKGINVEDIIIKSDCTEQELKDKLIETYKGLDQLTFEKFLLVYQEGQEAYCPVCNTTSPLMDWMDAYSSPLNFFEVSNLCDICGDKGGLALTENSSFCECDNNCLSKTKVEEDIENRTTVS